jgi:aminotransferase
MTSSTDTAIPPSAGTSVNIFEIMDRARSRPNLISMGLGDPDLATPAHIVAAAKQAIAEGRTGPAPVMGLPELRRAIASKLARDNGVEVDPETEVLETTGGQEALFLVIQALIEPGEEVVMPDPRYTSYDEAIALAGGMFVLVPST